MDDVPATQKKPIKVLLMGLIFAIIVVAGVMFLIIHEQSKKIDDLSHRMDSISTYIAMNNISIEKLNNRMNNTINSLNNTDSLISDIYEWANKVNSAIKILDNRTS